MCNLGYETLLKPRSSKILLHTSGICAVWIWKVFVHSISKIVQSIFVLAPRPSNDSFSLWPTNLIGNFWRLYPFLTTATRQCCTAKHTLLAFLNFHSKVGFCKIWVNGEFLAFFNLSINEKLFSIVDIHIDKKIELCCPNPRSN